MTVKEKFKRFLIAAFFPQRCPFCRRVIDVHLDICEECTAKLPQEPYFRRAAGGFPCTAPLLYQDDYAAAVKRFKFHEALDCAHPLALLLYQAAARQYDLSKIDVITCVPMHVKSLDLRGFNQSELLAKEFAAAVKLPFAELLEKHRVNEPQHSLRHSQRAENIKGVFRIKEGAAVKNKRILLIDDIITTGNTLGECAAILKMNGCREVLCAAVCTTPH